MIRVQGDFASPCLTLLLLFILVAFHSVGLTGAGLTVGKDGRMEPLNHLRNEPSDLQLVKNLLLIEAGVNDFVEFEILRLSTLPIASCLLFNANKG